MSMSTHYHQLSGIILAAGLSRRAAPHNKLLLKFKGRSAVRSVAEAFIGAGLAEVIVVTGHERERIESELEGLSVRFVYAEDYAKGMGCSLARGLREAAQDAQGFVFSPGDLPDLKPALVLRVTESFRANGAEVHIIPTWNGARGHPVVIGAWLRKALEELQGDIGARVLLAEETERARCCFLPVDDPAILRDVDVG